MATAEIQIDVAVRKQRLREYLAAHGGVNAVARRAELPSSYISQLANDQHPFGSLAARRLEKRLGMSHKWLEGIESPSTENASVHQFESSAVWIEAWDSVGLRPVSSAGLGKLAVPIKGLSERAFVVQMGNDSMLNVGAPKGAPSITTGMWVICDPEIEVEIDDVVIARHHDAKVAVCRQVIDDAGERYLRPLNGRYHDLELVKPATLIIGKVMGGFSRW